MSLAVTLTVGLAACSDDAPAVSPSSADDGTAVASEGAAPGGAEMPAIDLGMVVGAAGPDQVVADVHATGTTTAPHGTLGDGPATSRTATVDGAATVVITVTNPAGATLARNADGTISVRVGATPDGASASDVSTMDTATTDGTTVGGITVDAPGADVEVDGASLLITTAEGTAAEGTTTDDAPASDDGAAAASSDPGSTAPGTTGPGAPVVVTLGADALVSATWGEAEGGRSLAVDPSPWARGAGMAGVDATWSAVVAAEPDADVPGMRDQLDCHAVGAPDKATWNLEPWRPDVGLLAVMVARCNPT
ncbi:uncharacterized protein DUF2599 [Sediminihabitans luteus]|uniref:Uncharacterized protein DUF2599 n=1 Tax=Sediminihabitans luteus TaxID=1138585 RepID=A0A2M9D0V6_9CELL|nr:uncharacterized protein DUF2599 [Sediminihabitans luteus]GII98518.1 hypothetical protein Slu03_08960 [Sediminihabitans luteus]